HVAVDLDTRRTLRPRQVERERDGAAFERFRYPCAGLHLERFVARRQFRAHVETARVYAADFPRPGEPVLESFRAGKPGHAGDGQGFLLSVFKRGRTISAPYDPNKAANHHAIPALDPDHRRLVWNRPRA